MKKLSFAEASVAYIIFMVGARGLILFHPQGLKPRLLNSLTFTKEKEKIHDNARDYASLNYFLLLTKRFQVYSLSHAYLSIRFWTNE